MLGGAARRPRVAGLADLLLIRGTDLNIAPVVDVETSIVRSATPANVDTVLIDGRILKRDGHLTVHDAARVVSAATEASDRVRDRAGGRLARA